MKIAIPTSNGKLCSHFGHCDSFTFATVNTDKNEIVNMEELIPEEGISCQSAGWIASQGASKVLAGGMGARPMAMFNENNIEVITGCPELPVEEVVEKYLSNILVTGENSCGGEHHHCHGHNEGHHCQH